MRRTSSPASPAAPRPACRTRGDIARAELPNPVSATESCPRILAEQPAAHPAGADIDNEHGENDQQQDRADVGVVEFPDRNNQFLADASGADEAHHGSFPDIDLEAQQSVAGAAG